MTLPDAPLETLIVDPNPLLAAGLARLLEDAGFGPSAGQVPMGGAGLATAGQRQPQVIVLDPTATGFLVSENVQRFAMEAPRARLLAYLPDAAAPTARACLGAGFRGLLPKSVDFETFARAVQVVLDGGVYIDEVFARATFETPATTQDPRLTAREASVLRDVALGLSLKEIAAKLGVSAKTVDTYKARAAAKLNLTGRPDIVRFAIRSGWMQAA